VVIVTGPRVYSPRLRQSVLTLHERKPRRVLYASLAILLVAALALEGAGRSAAAAWVRAVAGSSMLLWVWKIFRRPGVKDLLSYCLWVSGWMVFAGLWTTALFSGKSLAGYHLMFIGGFSLLTLGIGTRVVIRHGRHPLPAEGRVLRTGVVAALGFALAARLGAELAPGHFLALLGLSGVSWILAWVLWGLGAIAYMARVASPDAPKLAPGAVPRSSSSKLGDSVGSDQLTTR